MSHCISPRDLPVKLRRWSVAARRAMLFSLVSVASIVPALSDLSQAVDSSLVVSFRRDVAPLLNARCEACHGERVAKGDFRLDSFARLMDAGNDGDGQVVPGKPADSYLLDLLTSDDKSTRMPKDAPPLPPGQIELVRRWLPEGARFDGSDPALPLVEIMTPVTHPAPPDVYPRPLPITSLAFNADGTELFAGGLREVTVWNADDGKLVRRIKNIAPRTYALALSPDGGVLAVGSGDPGRLGEVRMFDARSGDLLHVLTTLRDSVLDLKFSSHGRLLAVASADRSIRVFQAATGERQKLIATHGDAVTSIAFSPDDQRLAAVSLDRAAKAHDLATGRGIASFTEHSGPLYCVAFSPDGKQVFSSGKEKTIRIWDASLGKKVGEIVDTQGETLKLVTTESDLFAAGADKRVRQYTATDRKLLRTYESATDWIYALAIDPPRQRLAAGCYDGTVRVWNMKDGTLLLAFMAAPGL